jgi:pSer/pThr/pTyr-binding forkhead associated (FHA) protein
MPKYVLTFLSGKYQHGHYDLPEEGLVTIGRTAEADLILAEDMISRRHATVRISHEGCTLTDLNSTNGTYVNGERIARINLNPGDRILIGSSLLALEEKAKPTTLEDDPNTLLPEANILDLGTEELLESTKAAEAPYTPPPATIEISAQALADYTMDGHLQDASLADLLRLFAANQRTGALTLSASTASYTVWIAQGQLHHITQHADHKPTQAMRMLCRLLRWSEGSFVFHTQVVPHNITRAFQQRTEDMILEATRQNDELDRILPDLPPPQTEVQLANPLVPKFSALSKNELDILQTALNHNTLETLIEHAPGTDLEVITTVLKLLREGYLE